MAGGELQVLNGYDHVILGRLRVRRLAGYCEGAGVAALTAVQRDVLKQLKAKAFDVGGNAVIYASSVFGTEAHAASQFDNECRGGTMLDMFGSGWVVILKPKAAPPAQPATETQPI
jgi:hypothetical protein